MEHPDEAEIREAYATYVRTREKIQAGELGWDALAEFFTEDAVFVDPAWGRVEGLDAIRKFLEQSMAGLDDWSFPHEWTMVEGRRVVSLWQNRLGGTRADGSFYQAPGISVLTYAGDGKFSFEMDLLNMVEVNELLRESGWRPSAAVEVPPRHPRR